jgi:hypothetical protein
MLKMFLGGKPDHPMADLKEAKRILEELPLNDAYKSLEELTNWLESVGHAEGFKPEYRAQILLLLDEAAQVHVRKLARDYLAAVRPSKFQENRLWLSVFGYWRQAAVAFATCIDVFATGAKGGDALKNVMPLLAVRAMRALAAQLKWQSFRYGPMDAALWGILYKIYALADSRKFAASKVTVYPAVPGDSSPELEFLKAVMFSASSPDSLLPLETELMERLVAHYAPTFKLLAQPEGAAYWLDLAGSVAPLRLIKPPAAAPMLRYFSAGGAIADLEKVHQSIKSTGGVPSSINLGGSYDPAAVIDALEHLSIYWSTTPPERKAPRHQVKSRLIVSHGFDGLLGALDPTSNLDFDTSAEENWIVQNVSTGGFGAMIPQVKGDWLKIGCLLGLQPEGGKNWVVGVMRRVSRDTAQQASVGIQTIAKSATPVVLRMQSGQLGTSEANELGILLDPLSQATSTEALVVLRAGAWVPGQNLEIDTDGVSLLLMPIGVAERGEDYELVRFRQMIRDTE